MKGEESDDDLLAVKKKSIYDTIDDNVPSEKLYSRKKLKTISKEGHSDGRNIKKFAGNGSEVNDKFKTKKLEDLSDDDDEGQ